jgi:hypothetical protein
MFWRGIHALLVPGYNQCLLTKIKAAIHSHLMAVADLFAFLIASYAGWF